MRKDIFTFSSSSISDTFLSIARFSRFSFSDKELFWAWNRNKFHKRALCRQKGFALCVSLTAAESLSKANFAAAKSWSRLFSEILSLSFSALRNKIVHKHQYATCIKHFNLTQLTFQLHRELCSRWIHYHRQLCVQKNQLLIVIHFQTVKNKKHKKSINEETLNTLTNINKRRKHKKIRNSVYFIAFRMQR